MKWSGQSLSQWFSKALIRTEDIIRVTGVSKAFTSKKTAKSCTFPCIKTNLSSFRQEKFARATMESDELPARPHEGSPKPLPSSYLMMRAQSPSPRRDIRIEKSNHVGKNLSRSTRSNSLVNCFYGQASRMSSDFNAKWCIILDGFIWPLYDIWFIWPPLYDRAHPTHSITFSEFLNSPPVLQIGWG